MFDTKSDFALNKLDRDAIVCRSVTGVHIRLTREDFASEEEFLRWKVWSDGDYYDTEKDGRGFYDYGLPLAPPRGQAGGGPFHRGGHSGRAGRCRGQLGTGPENRLLD